MIKMEPLLVCQITYVSLRLRVQNWTTNGISRVISALCINCLISILEYSRIIDYSIIWMCIWCGLLQKLYKIKKSELLNSKVYSRKFQNGQYSRIWISIWNGPFQNLNWGLKNQKSELFLWNLMVKYWSDRIKSWIYTDFRAFRTSHQLLSLAVVYRSNRGMRVWVKTEGEKRNLLLNFNTCHKVWWCFFRTSTRFQYAFNMHYRFQHALKFSTHFQTWKFETFTVTL